MDRARAIHESVITIDTHDDISSNFATTESDPGQAEGRRVTLPKMREGGLDVAFFVVYVGQTERTPENYADAKAEAIRKFEAIHRLTDEMYPDEIGFAWTPDDVERLHAEGKLVAAIGIENGYSIGTDLSLLEDYYARGARYFGLTHIGHNDLADSSIPRENLGDAEEEHGGLSELGELAIAEANRLGIMVDVSHSSGKTAIDAARVSKAPIIASHSAVRELADSPRNLTDEELLAIRDNGGVAADRGVRWLRADPLGGEGGGDRRTAGERRIRILGNRDSRAAGRIPRGAGEDRRRVSGRDGVRLRESHRLRRRT